MKKVLSLLLLAFMPMLASMPVQAYDFQNGVFRYDIVGNNSVEVVRNPSYSGDIVIPSSVYYNGKTYTVTGIEGNAFGDIFGINSVTIPNSVTYIGNYAFEDGFMTSVTIGSGVKSIGMGAFQTCRNLSSITIPSSVTSIGSSAFKSCFKLKTIISERTNPIEIGDNVFSDYTTQATLIVPAGSKSAYQSKAAWNKFQDIVEFEKKRTIHVATAGTLPNLISEYEKWHIEELKLTGNINGTDLGFLREMAGRSCKGVDYHSGIYPKPAPECKIDATQGMLKVLDISEVNIVSGGTYLVLEHGDSGKILDYEVSSANIIPSYLFLNCKLTSIKLPQNISSIGAGALYGCSGLTSVTIPNSVTSIGEYAFRGCSGLTSITIPNSVTYIGNYAFSGSGWYNNQANGLLYLDKWLFGYKGDKPVGELKIVEGTKGIAGSAFSGCSGLTSITIPNSVTSIGLYAFSGCSGLTSVTIPNSVTSPSPSQTA